MKTWLLVPAVMLFIAIFSLPYGYYILLRYVVCMASVIIIIRDYKKDITWWMAVFGVVAILFNPVLPIHFYQRSTWSPVDALTGVLFVIKSFAKK